MAKERKFFSILSTANSGVNQKGVSAYNIFDHKGHCIGGGGGAPEESINVETRFGFKGALRLDCFLSNDTTVHLVSDYMCILYVVTFAPPKTSAFKG